MDDVRKDFLAVARSAANLLRTPAVGSAWTNPSALPQFSVGGLASHLAHHILVVRQVLADPVPAEPTITLSEHFGRARWIGAGLEADINVLIRRAGEEVAAGGVRDVLAVVESAVAALPGMLEDEPDRPVRLPYWGAYSLRLDDMLVTRMMELLVHSDDLAFSVRVPTPAVPLSAVETVVGLLARLAVRRHGPTAVVRAFSRAERAPDGIAAF
jgi:hypothetical protein